MSRPQSPLPTTTTTTTTTTSPTDECDIYHDSSPLIVDDRRQRPPSPAPSLSIMKYTSPEMPPTPEDYTHAFPDPTQSQERETYHQHDHDDNSHATNGLSRVLGGSKAVAPFLARHIPNQYAPQGGAAGNRDDITQNDKPNTKFCYRHRPDLKCRRTVDESRMESLQKALGALPQKDQEAISFSWSVYSACPSAIRNIFLDGVLAMSCFPQLSYLTSGLKELIKIDFIAALPAELSFKILQHLDTVSLCKAAQVSRKWRSLADDDTCWHHMCEQHIDRKCTKCGWGLPILERQRLLEYKQQKIREANGDDMSIEEETPDVSIIELSKSRKRSAEEDASSSNTTKRICSEMSDRSKKVDPLEKQQTKKHQTRPWKDVYRDRFKVGANWEKGRYHMKAIKAHDNGVMCLQFDDEILATGSYDTTIKIWDIKTGKHKRTLAGHTAGVRTLQFDGTKLISGSLDKTVKIWDLRTGECKRTIVNTDGVLSLNFDGDLCVTGSKDRIIKVYNFRDKSMFALKGHTDWVNHVKLDLASRTIFSSSDDSTCKLWDLDTKQCIRTFRGHTGPVQQILPLPSDFEFEEEENNLNDEDATDAVSTSSSSDSEELVEGARENYGIAFQNDRPRPLPPRYMITGALDNTLRLWDTSTGRTLRKFFGHVEGVWALGADSLRVISGAEDRMVKIWDTRTGKCDRTFAGHVGPVSCIGLSDSRMVTGSEDCEVRIYDFSG